MNTLRILRFGALLTLMPICAGAKTSEPVAIVYSLTGEASLAVPKQPLHLLDRLPARTTVEVGPGSRLALAFVSGLRYEMGEGSKVTLGPRDLVSRTGPVQALLRVPRLPRLAPIAEDEHPGRRAGAIRIRAERITGLYPRRGAAAFAGETVLRFHPVAGARSYKIDVQDGRGRTVFLADADSPTVKVPAGRLLPGFGYLWTVRTLDRPGAVARGEAVLVLLSEKAAQAREEARKILAAEGPGSLPLLAEIDRSLGLWLEAREDLRVALDDKPGDPALREALAEIEMRLEDDDDPE